MSKSPVLLALLLAAAPAAAQSPPLQGNTPSPDTTVTRPDARRASPDTTEATRQDPNARNRSNGQVSAPARIDTPVQVIAPEKK